MGQLALKDELADDSGTESDESLNLEEQLQEFLDLKSKKDSLKTI